MLPYLLVAPAVLLCLIWRVLPLIMVAGLAFFESDFLSTTWAGLANYRRIFTTPDLWSPILNTWWYVVLIVPGTLVLSLSVALSAQHLRPSRQHVVRMIVYIPGLVSAIVMSTIWRWIFHYDGLISWAFGVHVRWFSSRVLAIGPISLIQVLSGCGFYAIILMAALKAIPREHYEAAEIEGATRGQQRRRVMLPQILPTVGLCAILLTAGTLQMWGWVYMLAPYPYASTMMYAIFHEGFLYGRFGVASAYSVLLMVITIGVIVIQRRMTWKR